MNINLSQLEIGRLTAVLEMQPGEAVTDDSLESVQTLSSSRSIALKGAPSRTHAPGTTPYGSIHPAMSLETS